MFEDIQSEESVHKEEECAEWQEISMKLKISLAYSKNYLPIINTHIPNPKLNLADLYN